jgi:hypothetical protein
MLEALFFILFFYVNIIFEGKETRLSVKDILFQEYGEFVKE